MCCISKPLLQKEALVKTKSLEQSFMLSLDEQVRITILKSQVAASEVEKESMS